MNRGELTRRGRQEGEVGKKEWVRRFWKMARFIISSVHLSCVKLSVEERREHGRLGEQARLTAKR